jgi:hypothetical protein
MLDISSSATPFNGALETGVRTLTILAEASPCAFDLQKLVYFDYLIVHSGDAGGPTSLHPSTPLRNGELLVRRTVIEQGVLLMVSRGLVERLLADDGIGYAATDEATPFLECLTSVYSRSLRERAEWAMASFGDLDDDELKSYFDANFERWTKEFQSNASTTDRLL